ncbi:hypothetical protein FisN_1Hh075 [Fistulifera solaris]|uniref:Lon protease homolog n=1 Tax=Fistulifera solaris TaxID=1519565 RepID=A0A1Z5JDQ2_FISSO|nr:hypothetical protein FisN_1Hh075 [Fistulifera solaris]|eukprot:GAX12150.1 hypothetical protein FisN_1Hh075 [Fistulifera solaris]
MIAASFMAVRSARRRPRVAPLPRWFSSSSSSSSDDNKVVVVPEKIPFGEAAPRMPHTLGLPLQTRPIFPGLITSITLTDPPTIQAMEELWNQDRAFLSCFLRRPTEGHGTVVEVPEIITDPLELYETGTLAEIQRFHKVEEETTATLTLLAHRRVDLLSIDELGPPLRVNVKHWPRLEYAPQPDQDITIRALSNEIISTIRQIAQMNPLFRESLNLFPMRFDANDPFKLADFAASISASGGASADLQAVLAERDPEQRLHLALVLLNRELSVSQLQKEINQKVEEKMTETQRKYFLMEQLKSIKKELGMERDDKDALIEKYQKKLEEYGDKVPKEVNDVIQAEMEKFSTLEKNSPEYQVTRSYLDWLLGVPWGVMSEENFDLAKARRVLDQDHYGLEDVKDAILQFIAIGKLKGTVEGKILCLAGPPGTGKTSIGKSIAQALNRETYIGAMPGKVIQSLKTVGTSNPVILIDEIDKLGSGFRGDPASALLEVLDPSQNSTFRDHFLDVPVDISQVLFLCTANELDRIPGPLLDRMEIIRLPGYDFPEKVTIAENYLVPKSFKESGLMVEKESETIDELHSEEKKMDDSDPDGANIKTTPLEKYVHAPGIPEGVAISREAIQSLVRWYAREAGVRNLAKYIDRITRKLALQIVAEQEGAVLREKSKRKSDSWTIDESNLVDYVGKQIFTSDRLYQDGPLPNGIVMGLAYTSMGGSALYIETQGIQRAPDAEGKPRGGGHVKVTGQLGDVMKESADIAYTVARARLHEIDPANSYFDTADIHLHVPEGATPKDGPSAGITMVTSLLSLATGKPVRNDLAMTGEISLTGKVLPVGGIREKIMAARRAGITCVILPQANQRDFDEIPEYLKEGLHVEYADDYQKVYDVALAWTP